jgi:hypothetical protein
MSATDFLDAMGHDDCDNAFACKSTFPTDAGVTFDQAFGATATACYADAAMYDNAPAVEAAITAGKITYDGAAAATCAAGIVQTACPAFWASGPTLPGACDGVMVGKTADGAACTTDYECATATSICDATSKKCGPDPQGAKYGRTSGLAMHLGAQD